jgi:hypothetical protein
MARAPISVAATSTLAMVRAAESRGVETADLLRAAGVARELLDDPDARLPGPTVLAIWSALRERTGDPALQLVAPACLPFGAYRVIDYLVGASATVGDGMRRFAGYFRLIADAVTLTIADNGAEHAVCLAMADGGAVPPVYVDYVFAALVTRIRMQIRPGLRVLRVELRQAEPPVAAPYAKVFGAPVRRSGRYPRPSGRASRRTTSPILVCRSRRWCCCSASASRRASTGRFAGGQGSRRAGGGGGARGSSRPPRRRTATGKGGWRRVNLTRPRTWHLVRASVPGAPVPVLPLDRMLVVAPCGLIRFQ